MRRRNKLDLRINSVQNDNTVVLDSGSFWQKSSGTLRVNLSGKRQMLDLESELEPSDLERAKQAYSALSKSIASTVHTKNDPALAREAMRIALKMIAGWADSYKIPGDKRYCIVFTSSFLEYCKNSSGLSDIGAQHTHKLAMSAVASTGLAQLSGTKADKKKRKSRVKFDGEVVAHVESMNYHYTKYKGTPSGLVIKMEDAIPLMAAIGELTKDSGVCQASPRFEDQIKHGIYMHVPRSYLRTDNVIAAFGHKLLITDNRGAKARKQYEKAMRKPKKFKRKRRWHAGVMPFRTYTATCRETGLSFKCAAIKQTKEDTAMDGCVLFALYSPSFGTGGKLRSEDGCIVRPENKPFVNVADHIRELSKMSPPLARLVSGRKAMESLKQRNYSSEFVYARGMLADLKDKADARYKQDNGVYLPGAPDWRFISTDSMLWDGKVDIHDTALVDYTRDNATIVRKQKYSSMVFAKVSDTSRFDEQDAAKKIALHNDTHLVGIRGIMCYETGTVAVELDGEFLSRTGTPSESMMTLLGAIFGTPATKCKRHKGWFIDAGGSLSNPNITVEMPCYPQG